jgi:hypothetical protein
MISPFIDSIIILVAGDRRCSKGLEPSGFDSRFDFHFSGGIRIQEGGLHSLPKVFEMA